MTFDELIEKGEFILYKEYENNYLWSDWNECNELKNANEELFVYTVIHEGNSCWIVEGVSWINRLGYLFSRKYVPIEGDIEY